MSVWVPLEANPQVWNVYIKKLGVTGDWAYADVFGLDEELLQFVPQPVLAILLLFPITDKYEAFKAEEEARIKAQGQVVSPNVYFMRQTIGNACGTIGLLHSLANNQSSLGLAEGPLKAILDKTKRLAPEERAKALETDTAFAKIHAESSAQGQTAAPSADEDVDLHFTCFVQVDGHLYELDGRKPFPINHGPSTDVLRDTVGVIKAFMERDTDQVNFSVIALGPAQE